MSSRALFAVAIACAAAWPAAAQSWMPKEECKQVWKSKDGQYRAGESYADYLSRVRRTECYKNWTLLVYMAADNNLSPYAGLDLFEMEASFGEAQPRGASTINTDLVVQLDPAGARPAKRFHMFEGKQPYRARKPEEFPVGFEDKITSPVVSTLSEIDSADPKELEDFLSWGMKAYPAKHYLVVVWGHGQGWSPAPRKHSDPANSPYGGVAFDDTSKNVMNIPGLSGALRNVSAKILDGRAIDVYVADACLMQMGEVLTELSDSVRFAVGSTQVQSLLGLPYRRLLWELNKNSYLSLKKDAPPTADDVYLLAKMIPQLYKKSLDPKSGLQGRVDGDTYRTLTSSAVNLAEFRRLAMPALKNFSDAMEAWIKERPLRKVDIQGLIRQGDFLSYEGSARDLSAFLMLVKTAAHDDASGITPGTARLLSAIDAARDAIRESVVSYAFGADYKTATDKYYLLGYRVLSSWVPSDSAEYAARVGDFTSSRFYKLTGWNGWLAKVFK